MALWERYDRTVRVFFVCGVCSAKYRRYAKKINGTKGAAILVVKGLDLRTDDPAVERLVYPKSS